MKAKRLLMKVILTLSVAGWIILLGISIVYAAPPQQGGIAHHRVAAGENLARIAARYGTTVSAIARRNNISNPNLIYAGQHLVIPTASAAVSSSAAPDSAGCVYRIVRGDTLSKIASQHGTTVEHLMSANGLSSTLIWAGTTLRVPCGRTQQPCPPVKSSSAPRSSKGVSRASYRVKSGDTLTGIALLYHTTVRAIMGTNSLSNPHHIYAGQNLQISLR